MSTILGDAREIEARALILLFANDRYNQYNDLTTEVVHVHRTVLQQAVGYVRVATAEEIGTGRRLNDTNIP